MIPPTPAALQRKAKMQSGESAVSYSVWQRMFSAANRTPRLLANFAKNIDAAILAAWHPLFWSAPNVWKYVFPGHIGAIRHVVFQRPLGLS